LTQAKIECKASTFARKLLSAVFTDEALLACSVSGGLYKAAGKDKITSKPALDADTISLILGELLYLHSWLVLVLPSTNLFICFNLKWK